MRRTITIAAWLLGTGLVLGAGSPAPAGRGQAPPRPQPAGQAPAAPQPVQLPAPAYATGVDLILVDATVVDDKGTPVQGLDAGSFDVTVDGRPRPVTSVRYVDTTARQADAAAGTGAFARSYSTNDVEASSNSTNRTIVLAIDHGSFLPGRGLQTMAAARRFVETLDPRERVALAAFPAPYQFVPPTANKALVLERLSAIVGTGEPFEGSSLRYHIGVQEAFEIDMGSQMALDAAFERECSTVRLESDRADCLRELQMGAPRIIAMVRDRTAQSLNGLRAVLDRLEAIEGRKALVLVSAGLFGGDGAFGQDYLSEFRQIADAAAAGHVTMQVLHVDTAMIDAFGADRMRMTSSATTRDTALMARGLDLLAGLNGGWVFRVVAAAEGAFERIGRELSGFYELGIDSVDADRDGKPHEILVKVRQRGVSIRHRQRFTIRGAAAADAGPAADVATALKSGRTLRDVPLRVATHTLLDPGSDKLRVVVRADIGVAVAGPADLNIGLALYDDRGQSAGATTGVKHVEPSKGADPTWAYLETLSVKPGTYTLRLAVADVDGRVGTVTHRFEARLAAGTNIRLSDLIVIDPDRVEGDAFVPSVDGQLRGREAAALVEVYPGKSGSVSDVMFALSDRVDGPPIVRQKGDLVERKGEARSVAAANLAFKLLPPGDYVLTATASAGGRVVGTVSRGVTLLPVTAAAGAAAAPRMPFEPGELGAIGRPFARDDVLRADVVTYFLGRLRAVEPEPVPPAVAAALEAAAQRRFGELGDLLKKADATRLSVPFLRGLGLYAGGELEPAAQQFRAAIRVSSSFLPAAFYLGACYAAGGRDKEAVGAWQTSLITEGEARIIFDVLADALLRRQDGAQLASVVDEARERWPDDDLFLPRQAVAQHLTGDTAAALDTLQAYVARHPEDQGVVALALRLLYEAHAAGRAVVNPAADGERAAQLAERYRASGGADVALIDRWVAFIKQGIKD